MKFVTFNIRLDWGRDGEQNFPFRKPHIIRKIQEEQPDIICFQEVLPHVATWLTQVLTGYYVVGCPREEHLNGEQVCIAYRPDRYSLLKMDTYWLSPTPDVPGSRYPEQSDCPRICNEVTLCELSSKKVFRVTNTHLDHEGQPARMLALKQIIRKLEENTFFPGIPSILTGDLNAVPDSGEIRWIMAQPGWKCFTENVGATYHGYGTVAHQIDYILACGALDCRHVEKWTDCYDGIYLSDHYPVYAELTL